MKLRFEELSLAGMTLITVAAVTLAVGYASSFAIKNGILDPFIVAVILSSPWIYFGSTEIFHRIADRMQK